MRFSYFIALPLSLIASAAMAEATPEGATALTSTLQTYLGATEGVVAVTPSGDAYAVTLDFAPLMAKIPAEGFKATVSPIALMVTENGDGTWNYTVDQAVDIAYDIPGQMKATTSYGSVKLSGVFDEALGDSREYHFEAQDISSAQTQTDPTMGEVAVITKADSMTMDGTAVAAGDAVDAQFTSTVANMTYDFTMPGGEGAEPMAIAATIAEGSADGAMTGYKPAALYGLLAWFVAHPDQSLIEADKFGLKTQLQTALPFFANFTMDGSYKDIAVTSPVGPFGLAEAKVTIDANGAVADGKFREAFSIAGLQIPAGLVPPFAEQLVPTDLSFDVAASKFDLAAAVGVGLGLLDLSDSSAPFESFEGELMAAIMPTGAVDITIAPGAIKSPLYNLAFEGAFSAGPAMPMPVGKATLTATGLTAVEQALAAAPPEMGGQITPMLKMAEAMATPGADGALIWELESTAEGGFLVNGTNMMGGQ